MCIRDSEKVVRGMTENALKGIYNGGTIPFGYMIDETRHYQPDPLLAPYVEQTFQKLSLIHIYTGALPPCSRRFRQIHPERFRPGGGLCPKRTADR